MDSSHLILSSSSNVLNTGLEIERVDRNQRPDDRHLLYRISDNQFNRQQVRDVFSKALSIRFYAVLPEAVWNVMTKLQL